MTETEIYIEDNHYLAISPTDDWGGCWALVRPLYPQGNGIYTLGDHSSAHRNYLKTLKRVTDKEVISQITKILTK